MRILGISHINSGCGFHRVVLPLGYMDDIVGTITNLPTEEIMSEGWDIVLADLMKILIMCAKRWDVR